ncbi:MAG TPA: SDR family NAD(P)-dependent oxidoreductase [Candidatus Eisenbacteria bacterium]|nr:SDR family NAD(P)-dependent oxidoreductase [Candidatus Eisenbacteria bacterium]
MNLRGAVVLLTGASGGIGRAAAARLGAAGARVALHGRQEAALRETSEAVLRAGGESLVVPGDLRRAEDSARAVAAVMERFGRIDALVNNAGLARLKRIDEATDADIAEMIETNLLGTIGMTRAALPALLASKGALVTVGSFAGRVAVPYYGYYSATKFALVALSESWRRELTPRGVRVTTVLPAAVETSFLEKAGRERALGRGPAGIVLSPDRVAGAIVRALERHPAEIYLPRTHRLLAVLDVAFPRLSDRILRGLMRYSPPA